MANTDQRQEHIKDGARFPPAVFWLGLACLALSVAASFVLAAKHLNLMEAPGCGEGSGCDRAASSVWGSVPGLDWPLAFVGLAYFVAVAFAWTAARFESGLPRVFLTVVRLGAIFSVMLIAVMIQGRYLCWYCLTAHLGNFAFVAVTFVAPKQTAGAARLAAWAAIGRFLDEVAPQPR